jgi:hypothetical protein
MGDFDSQVEAMTNQLERQAERDAERATAARRQAVEPLSQEEKDRRAALSVRRRSLELSLASLIQQRTTARSDRYREQIQRSIAQLEDNIAGLGD